jgi:hypothetical protein
LSELKGQLFSIQGLSEEVSKKGKPYGVFTIELDNGATAQCYSPPLKSIAEVTYPATGNVNEAGNQIQISGADGVSHSIPITPRAEFGKLAQIPLGIHRIVHAFEEEYDGKMQLKVDVLIAGTDDRLRVPANAEIKKSISRPEDVTEESPLDLNITACTVMIGDVPYDRWSPDISVDFAAKTVSLNGAVATKWDKRFLCSVKVQYADIPNRKKSKYELRLEAIASQVKAAHSGPEVTAEAPALVSAFS